MKILFCAYRDWTNLIAEKVSQKASVFVHVKTPQELELVAGLPWDVIILVGWSWKVPAQIVNSKLVIGMHPSNLPEYAGGSPIQNQILDGVEHTYATLFKLNEQFDKGEIIDKSPINLSGHLDEVLTSISDATSDLILRFIQNFPNNTYTKQHETNKSVKRLKPDQSKLTMFVSSGERQLTCKEAWNFIRCREDHYPNAYFEDETGKLIIKHVEFIPK